jgi:hypothetical protein
LELYLCRKIFSVFNNNPASVFTECELRELIARLVHREYDDEFEEIMNLSHGIADKFYSNGTQCLLIEPNGLISNVDYTELVEFNFNSIE